MVGVPAGIVGVDGVVFADPELPRIPMARPPAAATPATPRMINRVLWLRVGGDVVLVGIAAGRVDASVVVVRGVAVFVVRLEEMPGEAVAARVGALAVADGAFGILAAVEVELDGPAGAVELTAGDPGADEVPRTAVDE